MGDSNDEGDEDYYVPLEDQRVFGAGIKRKRIAFVPQTSPSVDITSIGSSTKPSGVSSRYLSIVLPQDSSASPSPTRSEVNQRVSDVASRIDSPSAIEDPSALCPICNLPLSTPVTSSTVHESSIPHQASLPHSHPPSHLPRQHVGLKYLSSYGWDPDSRLGLGTTGDGIRVPIKAKEKKDTVGLGVDFSQAEKGTRKLKQWDDEPIKKLNAKQVKKMEEERKRKGEKLRNAFYQSDDVAKYLGEG